MSGGVPYIPLTPRQVAERELAAWAAEARRKIDRVLVPLSGPWGRL